MTGKIGPAGCPGFEGPIPQPVLMRSCVSSSTGPGRQLLVRGSPGTYSRPQNCSTVASSALSSTGFLRNPAACICCAALSRSAWALSTTTGISRRVLLELGTELLAIHDRHHHVEQDDAGRGRRRPQLLQSRRAVGGMERAVVHVPENLRERQARVGVVLDDEHRPAAAGCRHARARGPLSRPAAAVADRRGSSTMKVEPSPSLLATEIVPRCASTMCRAM